MAGLAAGRGEELTFSEPGQALATLTEWGREGHLKILWNKDRILRYLDSLDLTHLDRNDAYAVSDAYRLVGWALRDGLHPVLLRQQAVPVYERALLIVRRSGSKDERREASILSQLALVKWMSKAFLLLPVPGARDDFGDVFNDVQEALPLTDDHAIRSELWRHKAQFEITAGQSTFRSSIQNARRELQCWRCSDNLVREDTERILDDIECRGLLLLSPGDSELREAESLVKSLQSAQPSNPLRRLQRSYLEIILRAHRGDGDAPRLARELWIDPDLGAFPYQWFRIRETEAHARTILANRRRRVF